MKTKEKLNELSASELQVKLKQAHEERMNMKLKKAVEGPKSHKIQENRKLIARLETYLRMKNEN